MPPSPDMPAPLAVPIAAPAAAMERAARRWLDGLTAAQREAALLPFASPARGDWHYAPRRRDGLALKAMGEGQRAAALALLESALSPGGRVKARGIMALEEVLKAIEGRRDGHRDPLNYAFSLFGAPGTYPWGWRVEGHHLIVNVTLAGPEAVVVTPHFWGSNPARIPQGPRAGERVMAREYHLGLELARSLAPAQAEHALLHQETPGNILTERGRAQVLQVPTGLAFGELGEGQRQLLMTLVGEYVGNAAEALAAPWLATLRRDGLDALRLAWAGGMAEGQAFYYRIHGPRLLIEFDCTQDGANHIHSVCRDPLRDWGRDVLGEHYLKDHDHD